VNVFQNVDLDVDGSREILVERWKNYLRTSTNNNDTFEYLLLLIVKEQMKKKRKIERTDGE
jgi:hypothetical protein